MLADGAPIDLEHFPAPLRELAASGERAPADGTLEQLEIDGILAAIERACGNQTEAAALLGVTQRTLADRSRTTGCGIGSA